MKKFKKVLSSILLIVCLCVYAALAMGSGDSSSSSTSSGSSSKSSNDYGGYSKEYWDAARDSWDKNK